MKFCVWNYCPNCGRKYWLVWLLGDNYQCKWCGFTIWNPDPKTVEEETLQES